MQAFVEKESPSVLIQRLALISGFRIWTGIVYVLKSELPPKAVKED